MSRQTRNWILALVLIPAAAYGVAKLALWYSVKDALNDARESMSSVASLEHSRILFPVFGAFGATGIRIQPHIFEDAITIGSALVNIQDPVDKYSFLRATMNDTLPTRFNFSLNQVRVPLNGDIATWLDRRAPTTGTGGGTPAVCHAGGALSVRDIKAMGYEELVGDVLIDYTYDRRGGGLVTYMSVKFKDMFEITLEGKIPAGEVVFAVDKLDGVPKISDLSISVSDSSWSNRFNRYCADAMGITETEYIQQSVSEMEKMFATIGFLPSEELMAGLKKLTAGAVPLTLNLNPRDPLDVTQLATGGDPVVLIDKLGIEVVIDGKPIQNLGAATDELPADTDQAEVQPDETYKPTPVRELTLYLKNQVKIRTDDGKVHEGYLDSIDAGKIVMTRHLVGGSVTFDVDRKNVKEVLVLRP